MLSVVEGAWSEFIPSGVSGREKHFLRQVIRHDRNEKKNVVAEFPDRAQKMKELHARQISLK